MFCCPGIVDSSGAAYVFAADGNKWGGKIAKKFFDEDTEQFVFFLALLPILLILIPLFVFSGAMYFSSVHKINKTNSSGTDDGGPRVLSTVARSMTPLEEYASVHSILPSEILKEEVQHSLGESLDTSTSSMTSSTSLLVPPSRRRVEIAKQGFCETHYCDRHHSNIQGNLSEVQWIHSIISVFSF